MLPFGFQFGIFVILLLVSIKFGMLWGLAGYIAYLTFLKD